MAEAGEIRKLSQRFIDVAENRGLLDLNGDMYSGCWIAKCGHIDKIWFLANAVGHPCEACKKYTK